MTDYYIDADKPIKIVREYKSNTARMIDNYIDVDDVIDMFEDMIDDFENIPTADVRENEKGEWEEIAESGLSDLRRCSNCGHIEAVGLEIMKPKPNYCPFCGAQMMRGEA